MDASSWLDLTASDGVVCKCERTGMRLPVGARGRGVGCKGGGGGVGVGDCFVVVRSACVGI